MKTAKKIVLLWLCIFLLVPARIVSAEQSTGATNWTISNIRLEHTVIEFQISGVPSAQEATVIIETDDYFSSEETEKVHYEIPFAISSSTEKIRVEIPSGGYLQAGYYRIYVEDTDGKRTSERTASLYEHYYYFGYELYPNWAEITNDNDVTYNIRLIAGFENYDVRVEPYSTQVIYYPSQEIDTIIEIMCWDDYGCSQSRTATVENEKLSLPTLRVFKDSIAADFVSLSENERVGALVEGVVYYSEYGEGEDTYYSTIPNFITFPQVSQETETIDVWIESKNGSKSKLYKEEIEACRLDYCDITYDAFLSQATGAVADNSYGNRITRVSTMIEGVEYSCNVEADGTFKLTYPKQSSYKEITLKFSCAHGCYMELEEWIWNSLEYKDCDIVALISKATGEIYEDCRLVAKIGNEVYYSEYATDAQVVTVVYPQQKPGTKVLFWYEKKDTSQSEIFTVPISDRKYYLSVDARTGSLKGQVEAEWDNESDYKVYVKAGGQEYECLMTRSDWSYDNEYDFSCKYPLQKVGGKIQVIVRDSDGYEYVENIVLKNIKPSLSIKRIDTSTTKVQGRTVANSNITVKVGNKTYRGKANNNGEFSIKIKSKKAGTKVSVSVVSPEGYTNQTTKKIEKTFGYTELSKYVYRTSTTAKIIVYGGNKGDKLKIKIGSKTYTKKIKKNKKKQIVSVKIRKASAGTNIKMLLYDKFGKKKSSDTSMVYLGDRIYVGMSVHDVVLTTWGLPDRKNDWGTGSLQWVFSSGSSTLYAYISNGKVVSIQHLNY